jgi:hypothetical protein
MNLKAELGMLGASSVLRGRLDPTRREIDVE